MIPVFHPQTRIQLDTFIKNPSHALILSSVKGVGAYTAASYITEQLDVPLTSILVVQPEKNTISIDEVRSLYRLTKSSRDSKFVVIIDDADAMGGDAQNALLKLLEEPPSEVFFILTTHRFFHLLPTIASRATHIDMREVSKELSKECIARTEENDTSKTARILFLAMGRPAEIHRLLDDEQYYSAQIARMSDAKKILESDSYTRLVSLKSYMSDRDNALTLLEMSGLLLMHGLYKNITASTVDATSAVADTIEALHKNGNVRAQLLLLNQRLT